MKVLMEFICNFQPSFTFFHTFGKKFIYHTPLKRNYDIMLISLKRLKSYEIYSKDNKYIGNVDSSLFDQDNALIRFMVINTEKWFEGPKLLISPLAIDEIDTSVKNIKLIMTKKEVLESPNINDHMPLSRRKELLDMKDTKRTIYCYSMPDKMVCEHYPVTGVFSEEEIKKFGTNPPEFEPRLRSSEEVTRYYVKGIDGKIGILDDFIAEDDSWFIRYLIVDTRNWLLGKKVLIAFDWLEDINWDDKYVNLDLTKESIKNSPLYDPEIIVKRDYEVVLHDYYCRPPYWKKVEE